MKTVKRALRAWLSGMLAIGVLGLAACGGSGYGSSGSSSATTNCSNPSIYDSQGCLYTSLTDADGPFLSYTVTVDSLTLTRQDGAVVNVLPNATTVDFAQYTDVAEFLSLQTVPPGVYISGSMVLDYTNADIEVDVNGSAEKAAAVDQNGSPIGKLSVQIQLANQQPVMLVPGVPQLFSLDFDLTASNLVNTSGATPVVTVAPVLYAQVNPGTGKTLQLRGPLGSVDTGSSSFTIALRPFDNLSGAFGNPRVYTTANTTYLINMTGYAGSAGLQALQAAGPTTAVIAKGSYDFQAKQFMATQVTAGSSVPGGTLDAVEGVVTAISGLNATVRGATLIRAQQQAVFFDQVTVTFGVSTVVREASNPTGSFTPSDISVGQHILFMGTLTNTNPGSLAMDATNGFALLQHTRVGALVTTVGSGALTLNAQSFEGRPVSLFNFNGTGSNPASYVASTGALPLSGINVNDPVRIDGFVAPLSAPKPPDFNADSIIDFANVDAQLVVGYVENGGTTAPFTSVDANAGIVINMANPAVGFEHFVRQGPVFTTLTAGSNPTIVPAAAGGIYAIRLPGGGLQLFFSFSNFVTALNGQLNGSNKVLGVFAAGGYNNSSNILTAERAAVVFK